MSVKAGFVISALGVFVIVAPILAALLLYAIITTLMTWGVM